MAALALLINRDSGAGDADLIERRFRELGADFEAFDVRDCEAAAASGAGRLIVAGGDGSLGHAAEAAARAGIPIAVVAAGTANDFATRLGLPTDLHAACRLAAAGTELRALDLARAGSRPFLNVASVGLAPAAAEHARGLKGRIGALAYPIGAIRAGLGAAPIRCAVSCDSERVHEGEAWQVSVASLGAFGGGASLKADAADGRLDLVVIAKGNRLQLVRRAFGLRIGSVETQTGVVSVRCSDVELRLDADERLNVDGELIDVDELSPDRTVGFRVEREAFRLVVG